jgi:hypothetical protein
MSYELRWNLAKIRDIKASAIQPNPGMHDLRIKSHAPNVAAVGEPAAAQPRTGSHEARQVYLKKADFDPSKGGAGYTEGCQKCRNMRLGVTSSAPHSDGCRNRMKEHLGQSEIGKARV